jgi:hypothetical protein
MSDEREARKSGGGSGFGFWFLVSLDASRRNRPRDAL